MSDVIGPYVDELLALRGQDQLSGREMAVARAHASTPISNAVSRAEGVKVSWEGHRKYVDQVGMARLVAESYVDSKRPAPEVVTYDSWVGDFSDAVSRLYDEGERSYVKMSEGAGFQIGFARKFAAEFGGYRKSTIEDRADRSGVSFEEACRNISVGLVLKSRGVERAMRIQKRTARLPSLVEEWGSKATGEVFEARPLE